MVTTGEGFFTCLMESYAELGSYDLWCRKRKEACTAEVQQCKKLFWWEIKSPRVLTTHDHNFSRLDSMPLSDPWLSTDQLGTDLILTSSQCRVCDLQASGVMQNHVITWWQPASCLWAKCVVLVIKHSIKYFREQDWKMCYIQQNNATAVSFSSTTDIQCHISASQNKSN